MIMKQLSRKIWLSILLIPFFTVSCDGIGGLEGGSGTSGDEPKIELSSGSVIVEGYECVDLGLSVKWATYNVGAYLENDLGGFYSWGETQEKSAYTRAAYAHSIVTEENDWFLTKYCTDEAYGYESFKDDKRVLDAEDDVAHVIWKGDWRMPTPEEQQELVDNCTWTWITAKDTRGRDLSGFKVTSKKDGFKDRFIFLPAGGYKSEDGTFARSSYGIYWSNQLYEAESAVKIYAQTLTFYGGKYMDEEKTYMFCDSRERGVNVRAVHP